MVLWLHAHVVSMLIHFTVRFAFFSVSLADSLSARDGFLHMHNRSAALPHSRHTVATHAGMKQYTAEQKHRVLTHYTARRQGETLAQVLSLHGVSASRRAVEKWLHRWDGTPQSLEHRAVSGRPRVLSSRQVQQLVRAPILRANSAHRPLRAHFVVAPVSRARRCRGRRRRRGLTAARAGARRGRLRRAASRTSRRRCASSPAPSAASAARAASVSAS